MLCFVQNKLKNSMLPKLHDMLLQFHVQLYMVFKCLNMKIGIP